MRNVSGGSRDGCGPTCRPTSSSVMDAKDKIAYSDASDMSPFLRESMMRCKSTNCARTSEGIVISDSYM